MNGDASVGEGVDGRPGTAADPRLVEIAGLAAGDDRRRFFERHADLRRPETVDEICRRALAATAEGRPEAEPLVAAAAWLAADLDDDRSRGLSLRAGANLRLYRRDYKGARELYQRALASFQAAGDGAGAAITRSAGIGSLSHLGEYELAQRWADEARAFFRQRGDDLRLARLDVNIAHVYVRQDRFRLALEHYRSAAEKFRSIGRPADVGATLRNLAVCYQDLNDFDAAFATYQEARDHCREHGLHLFGLEIEYNIAYLYYLRGEYNRAIAEFDAARRRSREHGDRYHEGLCDLDQAEIYLELNLLDEAVDLAARAHERFAALGIVYDAAKARCYQSLAMARKGQARRALVLLEEARDLFVRQENDLWLAMIDLYRAYVAIAARDLEEAEWLASEAFDGFLEARVPSRTAAAEILLARLALERDGGAAEARRHCCSALGRLQSVGTPALEFQAQLVLARAEEAAGDSALALECYRRAETTLERLRGQLGTDDVKIAFSRDKRELYEGLVLLTLASSPGKEGRRAAFEIIERAKSRALIDLLASRAPELEARSGGDKRLVEDMRKLRQELHWHYHQIDQEELKGSERSLPRVERLRQEAQRRERRLQRTLRTLQSADPELASLQHSTSAGIDAVREVLPPDGALLEYFLARDRIYACVLTRDDLVIRGLGEPSDLQRLDRHLRLQLGKQRLGQEHLKAFGASTERVTRTILAEMYAELIAPVRRDLSCENLVVVPHGFLHRLPFAAFLDGDRYLIDDFTISFAPSASVFRLCCLRRGKLGGRSLVLGVPDAKAPLIEEEARAVARVLPHSRLLLGGEATREVLAEDGNGCAVVHLATHGHHRVDNPMFSAIQLGGGRLSLLDLYQLRLEAGLVVLSGCATGLSEVEGADELVGLTRGLLHAGARALVATLWDINDESTTRLMRSFYRGFVDNPEPAAELRTAQLGLRERYPEPYYWAPFVLVGRPGAAALTDPQAG